MTSPNLQAFSPSSGSRSQVNSGSGAVYDRSQTFNGGMTGSQFNSSGAYIGPKVIAPAGYSVLSDGRITPNMQVVPGTSRIVSSRDMTTGKVTAGAPAKYWSISGGNNNSYPGMTSSMNSLFGNPLAQGPVGYADKKTLDNVQERIAFNKDLASLFGLDYGSMFGAGGVGGMVGGSNPVKRGNFSISRNITSSGGPRKSWTDQLLDMPSRYQIPTGGPSGPQSVRQILGLQAERKAGYTRLPNPGTLDPNDWRMKSGPGYWGRPGSMVYNFDGSNTVSVKPYGSGELRGSPIPQY